MLTQFRHHVGDKPFILSPSVKVWEALVLLVSLAVVHDGPSHRVHFLPIFLKENLPFIKTQACTLANSATSTHGLLQCPNYSYSIVANPRCAHLVVAVGL
jgi:hypothetical protein